MGIPTSSPVVQTATRAAHLAKADLASSTVMEMTALAGTMGRHYAYKQVSVGKECEWKRCGTQDIWQ